MKDMLQPVIKCFVIPEGGLEYLIAKLLDRTYILIQLVQVGSYIYFNTSRAGWQLARVVMVAEDAESKDCLLYTSPSPRDKRQSRMPSSA